MNALVARDFVHLSIGRIAGKHPARQVSDVLPETIDIASERLKTGVGKRNKCLVGAQSKPKDPEQDEAARIGRDSHDRLAAISLFASGVSLLARTCLAT